MNTALWIRWHKALIIVTTIFILFSTYLFLRRGFYNLGIINKSFASTAATVAAITLFIGPLVRFKRSFTTLLELRRPLGLLALATGLSHVTISLFLLPQRFNIPWFIHEWPAIILGFLAISIWIYLSTISRNKSIKKLGGIRWVQRQQWGGHIAFYAIFFHLIFLKYTGWIEWFQGKTQKTQVLENPHYPPASLFVFLVMSTIILYRMALIITKPKNKQ